MRRDVSPEEQRQRVMHQINKQRRIDEVGHAAGLKVQQAVASANTTFTIHKPSSMVITLSVSYIQASPLP
jgi:hypothetical protein